MCVGFLGYGEIGSSLGNLYIKNNIDIKIKDISQNKNDDFKNINILNVCIPYLNPTQFFTPILNSIENTVVKLIIIHSSVTPGTTKEFMKHVKNIHVVHSPCRGVHPNLEKALLTFIKYVGSESDEAYDFAEKHFNKINIKTKKMTTTESELSKLISTSYYGMCIAFTNDVNKLCDKLECDFDNVMKEWQTSYNDGYEKLNMPHVKRPILYSSHDDKIGGHCVCENAKLLKKEYNCEFSDYILRYTK